MLSKLTLPQQRSMLRALPMSRKMEAKKYCKQCHMAGQGIMDIVKSIGSILGPIAKEIGPTVLKEFIIPLIKKKIDGKGIGLPGGTLRLAGQGKKKKPRAKGGMYVM